MCNIVASRAEQCAQLGAMCTFEQCAQLGAKSTFEQYAQLGNTAAKRRQAMHIARRRARFLRVLAAAPPVLHAKPLIVGQRAQAELWPTVAKIVQKGQSAYVEPGRPLPRGIILWGAATESGPPYKRLSPYEGPVPTDTAGKEILRRRGTCLYDTRGARSPRPRAAAASHRRRRHSIVASGAAALPRARRRGAGSRVRVRVLAEAEVQARPALEPVQVDLGGALLHVDQRLPPPPRQRQGWQGRGGARVALGAVKCAPQALAGRAAGQRRGAGPRGAPKKNRVQFS